MEDLRAPELLSAAAETLSNLRRAAETRGNLRPPELLGAAAKTLSDLRPAELLGAPVIPLDRISADFSVAELLSTRALRLSRPVPDLRPSGYLARPFSAARGLTCYRRAATHAGSFRV